MDHIHDFWYRREQYLKVKLLRSKEGIGEAFWFWAPSKRLANQLFKMDGTLKPDPKEIITYLKEKRRTEK